MSTQKTVNPTTLLAEKSQQCAPCSHRANKCEPGTENRKPITYGAHLKLRYPGLRHYADEVLEERLLGLKPAGQRILCRSVKEFSADPLSENADERLSRAKRIIITSRVRTDIATEATNMLAKAVEPLGQGHPGAAAKVAHALADIAEGTRDTWARIEAISCAYGLLKHIGYDEKNEIRQRLERVKDQLESRLGSEIPELEDAVRRAQEDNRTSDSLVTSLAELGTIGRRKIQQNLKPQEPEEVEIDSGLFRELLEDEQRLPPPLPKKSDIPTYEADEVSGLNMIEDQKPETREALRLSVINPGSKVKLTPSCMLTYVGESREIGYQIVDMAFTRAGKEETIKLRDYGQSEDIVTDEGLIFRLTRDFRDIRIEQVERETIMDSKLIMLVSDPEAEPIGKDSQGREVSRVFMIHGKKGSKGHSRVSKTVKLDGPFVMQNGMHSFDLDPSQTAAVEGKIPPGEERWGVPFDLVKRKDRKGRLVIDYQGRKFVIFDQERKEKGTIRIWTELDVHELKGSMGSNSGIFEAFEQNEEERRSS